MFQINLKLHTEIGGSSETSALIYQTTTRRKISQDSDINIYCPLWSPKVYIRLPFHITVDFLLYMKSAKDSVVMLLKLKINFVF